MEDSSEINWTKWATEKFPVTINGKIPTNAGYILKSFAESEGVDTAKFNKKKIISGRDIPSRQRREKRKIMNNISMPSSTPAKVLKLELKEKLKDGEIDIGDEIISTNVTTRCGSTQVIHARQRKTREVILKELERLDAENLLLNPEETVKLHVKIWHDHVTIVGNSYFSLMLQILFDNTIHRSTTTSGCSSQPIIEKPQLCILGIGNSSIQDQLKYSEDRLKDIVSLKDPIIYKNTKYQVIPRFVIADYPARAFECGQQIGGNYSCPCGIQAQHHNDFTKAISMPISTLEERESMVQNGILWKTRQTGLLKSITKSELLQENKSRNLYIGTSYQRPTKVSMLSDLTKELHGIHRRPALTSNSSSHIKDIAPELEIPNCEILHDYLGVVENLIEELPHHEPKLNGLTAPFQQRHERLRGIDARFFSIDFAEYTQSHNLDEIYVNIAQILVEISQICYSYAEQRTARQILRLLNITFMFGKLLKKIVGPKPKKVSPGKFYGIHFHGLITHLAEIYRLISIRSLVPEQEEATLITSNKLPSTVHHANPKMLSTPACSGFNLILSHQVPGARANSLYSQGVARR